MIRTAAALLPLILASAPPAFAQSHAGHTPAPQAREAAPLPAGCVRRGAPTADAARVGAPGAPVCPTGSVPERVASADPHAGHDMASPADPHAGHDMTPPQAGATPAPADPHAGHDMTAAQPASADPHAGHDMVAPADPHAGHDMTAAASTPPAAGDPHAGHAMGDPSMGQAAPDPHAGHDMCGMAMPPDTPTSADNPGRPPEDPAPPAAMSGPAHAADLLFDPAEMAAARAVMRMENGDVRATAVFFDQLEASFGDGDDAYAWEAQGWSGGDINRFWWKSEGEGDFRGGLEEAEVQALYSRAVRPFWDVQAGLRHDFRPGAQDTTHLVLGVQGLAPHWWEIDAAAFLSTEGDLTARAEAEYDQRITQRLILQPRIEVEVSAADIPELETGSGLTSVGAGVRLRYEFHREFAPYVGLEWSRALGDTADYIEASGRSAEDTRLLIGLRAWF